MPKPMQMRLWLFVHSNSSPIPRILKRSFSNHVESTVNNNHAPDKKKKKNKEDPRVVKWNKAIAYHMRLGHLARAQQLFDQMPRTTVSSYNTMLSGYVSNSHFALAISLFSRMPSRDIISYNTMLHCHVRSGHLPTARHLFDEMPVKDEVSYNTMISAYARHGLLHQAKELFHQAPVRNNISWNGLLAAYIHSGRFELAKQLFESKPNWDVISWNSMIRGYVQQKQIYEAQKLFDNMPDRDNVSWNTIISGFAQSGDMTEARRLFDIMPVEKDVFTWTAVVSGYAKNGNVEEARGMFEKMPHKNVVSWNAIIAAYMQNRRFNEARKLFDQMPCRDQVTWNTMLSAYGNAGMIEEAREMFYEMPSRDTVSWSAMLAAYSQVGLSEEVLYMFREMFRRGTKANYSSYACALSTCADMATLNYGTQLHTQLFKVSYGMGCFVGNVLLTFYFKCGSMDDAQKVFDEMLEKDTASWNTMISGYARHGFGLKAWEVFDLMKQTQIKPDDITLVGVLSASSHAGLVDKGISLFYTMEQVYDITPKPAHYTCMIDLLGRAGRLKEAQSLVKEMPFEPEPTTWGALLGASRVHREPEIGIWAAKKIFELEPNNTGMYVLLSNLYASYGKWSDVLKTRVLMGGRGARKVPGFSWIEIKNKVHVFSVGDSAHPDKQRIYHFLEELDLKMKKAGYVSATEMVLHDVEEEEKVHMLRYHSERLAVAFGILNVPSGRPIRIIKNLRVCEDCHNAIKYIAKIENRLIILRDSNRFHHFSGGSCSCGDYW
ncbi:hypothetical protein LUZ63_004290 [Rhynchospora breviuscula]|uniref:DYW domain-containing protein n=1 Tax=Rhynchospora breviuscula TaxID=2022672 RepID=A0A9Q0D293_9POAL|nr:hypothetical protein LUZ63_004290 [Rhynchospora breviuscula]